MPSHIYAGTLVRWCCHLNRPCEAIVLRGRVRTVYGRRLADVEIGDAGVTVTLPIADLVAIEEVRRPSDDVVVPLRRKASVCGADLTPGGSAA